MSYDSLYIDENGQTWSIRELLASGRPRIQRQLATPSLWSRTSYRRTWGIDLPSPAYILANLRRQTTDIIQSSGQVQHINTIQDHELRILSFIRTIERGEFIDPVIIGLNGSLWDGMHRLAALYACEVSHVNVLDFSDGRSTLLRSPVSVDEVLAPYLCNEAGKDVLRERFCNAQPYPHIFIPQVFEPAFAEAIMHESEGLAWTLSATEFYDQYEVSLIDNEHPFDSTALDSLREVALSPSFAELISAITGQTGLKISDVACHRSTPGQQIGIHNDFYPRGEVCRFTIHLNPDWQINEGGMFVTFASADRATVSAAYLPSMNSALLFEISPKSFHAVTAVTGERPRYSIVLSFYVSNSRSLDTEATRLGRIRENKLPLLRPEVVDVDSLKNLKTSRCSPTDCGGQCCRDGAGLLPEETLLLQRVALTYRDELSQLGVSDAYHQSSNSMRRTSVVTEIDGSTRCAWLMRDGKCSLQVLGDNHFQQPWFYKPLACMLVPFRVRSQLGARILTSDQRVQDSPGVTHPCLTYHKTINALEGVQDEIKFIAKVWDLDISNLVETSNQRGLRHTCSGFNTIGVVNATQTHLLTAVIDHNGNELELRKVSRVNGKGSAQQAEEAALRKITGRWFPKVLERCESSDTSHLSLVVGHVPLNVWLNSRPSVPEVSKVARDLLRALIALEDQQTYHLDLAPRNVLVHPEHHTVVIVDFEDATDSTREVQCAGGSFGYAAPEQYLNYLGPHDRLTESFFVGAVIYQAFAEPRRRKQRAFPFNNLGLIPESLRGIVAALVGDSTKFYDRGTRLSARNVLKGMESKRSFEIPPEVQWNELAPRRLPEEDQRRLEGPDRSTLLISRHGLTLLRGKYLVERWNGLVDVANAPTKWIEPLLIGPLLITPNGFMRSAQDRGVE
ncbi:MAG TPA: 2OG-Fe(II) oxygenase [Pyrinomonadaceae bacterium]|nr:2OG-Fe(II) oxygenase [Pyrinomonadaceae bacterium]